MKNLALALLSTLIATTVYAGTKRKPANNADPKTTAQAAAKAVCEISFGNSCTLAPGITCTDTSKDETNSSQTCNVVMDRVKGFPMPGGLVYRVELLNGRINTLTEHCGSCD